MNYVLTEKSINGIKINDKISEEELFEYQIIDRLDFIDTLIDWISEANTPNRSSDKEMMKQDLKMLINLEDKYMFSSVSTNSYIGKDDDNFDETCEELLEINAEINDA